MFHHHLTVKGSLSFSNPTVRAWSFQILAVIAVIGITIYPTHNTTNNLNNSGIISGFSFLDRSARFGIVQHLIDYEQSDTYGRVFAVGLLNTLLVSALCIVFVPILGSFLGLARLSDNWLLRKLSTIYVETFRNILPLLQISFRYLAVLRNLPGLRQTANALDLMFLSNWGFYIPSSQMGEGFFIFCTAVVITIVITIGLSRLNRVHQTKIGQLRRTWPIALVLTVLLPVILQWMFGTVLHWDISALRGSNFSGGMVLIPELVALTLTLLAYISASITEIIRVGIQAVPYGQHEAARSLGLPNPMTLRQVVIPQALCVIIPPLISQYLNIVKNSSLAVAIGYPDMVSLLVDTVLNRIGQATETIVITTSVYLIISLSISLLMNIYNRRIALIERQGVMMTKALLSHPSRQRSNPASCSLFWVRKNLFFSWSNSLLTLLCVWLIWLFLPPLSDWVSFQANQVGSTRADCTKAGVCWVFIHERFGQFMYGFYPHDQRWRVNLALMIGPVSIVPIFWKAAPYRGRHIAIWVAIYPIVVWWLMYSGFFGLEHVETRQWGGLTLTLIIASVGIAGALPWGILLALGRRSHMPVVRVLSVIFIEPWRGVSLITVLFMFSVMLPLSMSEGTSIDKPIRVLVGIILFQSAYIVEMVRGGLQALPKGQYEVAESLALGYWRAQGLVILPQALKLVISGLVNAIIALLKGTSLIIIIGLFDLFSNIQ